MVEPTSIPIFPLSLVLLPDELLPLHIFEERYKNLIADVRADGSAFGVVLQVDDGVASVGCTARLIHVLQELPDGRLNIIVRGEEPFRLGRVDIPHDPEAEPLTAAVVFLEDEDPSAGDPLRSQVESLAERYRALGGSEEEGLESALPSDADAGSTVAYSYRLAADLELEPELKQQILSSRNEGERLRLLLDHLELVVPRLELLEERKDAIRGNGKGT